MKLLFIFISVPLFCTISAQIDLYSASTALNQFSLKFLLETCRQAGDDLNLALSPYTIWNVMAIINEGAGGNTEVELGKVLGVPRGVQDREQFKKLQQSLTRNIMKTSDGVLLSVANAVFTRLESRLNPNYRQMIQNIYDVEVATLDFKNARNATQFINGKLSKATNGRIKELVNEDDLSNARIFVTSALYFKGLWDLKFNKSQTDVKPFYNERNEEIGTVHMMYNKGLFPLTKVLDNTAFAVELPYKDDKMSMIIILPLSTPLLTVVDILAEKSIASVLESIKASKAIFGNDPVKVYIPKFKIESDLNLNKVLSVMGMRDVFEEAMANLSGISPDPIFLSRVIHKAEIDVDEDGTVASSITVGDISNRIPPSVFTANKPFVYLIYDKETRSIVFMGRYSTPN